jgi:hypothetical protein
MDIEVIPTLIAQLRETMDGGQAPDKPTWIVDGNVGAGVLGVIDTLSVEQAFRAPALGRRSAAEHVAHLLFSLKLFYVRMQGEDPRANWKTSFDLPDRSPAGWEQLKRDLRKMWADVMKVVNEQAKTPIHDWPPIYVVGLVATIGHNAYHLGAIRQIAIAAGA